MWVYLLAGVLLIVGLIGAVQETHVTDHALPHTDQGPSGRAPTSPEALADARRAQQ